MDPNPKLFEALGKYAGLAGICVGLVLLVFLAILKKNTSPHNLSLVKQMMYLTFFIGVIGIGAWVLVQPRASTPPKDPVADNPPQHRAEPTPPPAPQIVIEPEEEVRSPETASGSCADFGSWARLCSKPKPTGWTIVSEHFDLVGDRAGCAYAECKKDPDATSSSQICYLFRLQGHNEQCNHPGNTGIQFSTGVLKVVWKHPAP